MKNTELTSEIHGTKVTLMS